MTNKEKEKAAKFFTENFHVHDDWAGRRVETINETDSVKQLLDKFLSYIEENPYMKYNTENNSYIELGDGGKIEFHS